MPLRTFVLIAVTLSVLLGADFALNGGEALLFLLRKLADFVEYLSFWR